MPKDHAKCRKWQQERRNRLREKFDELAKALPSYDPSKPLCHINILEGARKAIEELQEDIKKVLTKNKDRVKDEVIKKLQKRIKKLLIRNEQLHNLLKNVPNAIGKNKRFKMPTVAKNLEKQEMEKENTDQLAPSKKKKKTSPSAPQSATRVASKHRSNKKKATIQNNSTSSNCLFLIPPGNTVTPALNQPIYFITNPTPAATIKPQNINLGLQHTPFVTKSIPRINSTGPTLGPSTILLSNKTVLPVLPPTPVLVQSPRTIISVQQQPKNTTGITLPTVTTPKVVTSANNVKTTNVEKNVKKLLPILPQRKCITNTTHINKVPIPSTRTKYTCTLTEIRTVPKKCTKPGLQRVTRRSLSLIHQNCAAKRKKAAEAENAAKKSKPDVSSEILTTQSAGDNTKTTKTTEELSSIPDSSKVSNPPQISLPNTKTATDAMKSKDEENGKTKTTLSAPTPSPPQKNVDGDNTAEQQVQDNPQSGELDQSPKELISTSTPNLIPEELKNLELNLSHSELSNEIFATLQDPSGCQNPESTSPTAAFLLSFPLVSSFKGTDVIDEDNNDSQSGVQSLEIRNLDGSKSTQNDNLLTLENFSFFSSRNICDGFYGTYDVPSMTSNTLSATTTSAMDKCTDKISQFIAQQNMSTTGQNESDKSTANQSSLQEVQRNLVKGGNKSDKTEVNRNGQNSGKKEIGQKNETNSSNSNKEEANNSNKQPDELDTLDTNEPEKKTSNTTAGTDVIKDQHTHSEKRSDMLIVHQVVIPKEGSENIDVPKNPSTQKTPIGKEINTTVSKPGRSSNSDDKVPGKEMSSHSQKKDQLVSNKLKSSVDAFDLKSHQETHDNSKQQLEGGKNQNSQHIKNSNHSCITSNTDSNALSKSKLPTNNSLQTNYGTENSLSAKDGYITCKSMKDDNTLWNANLNLTASNSKQTTYTPEIKQNYNLLTTQSHNTLPITGDNHCYTLNNLPWNSDLNLTMNHSMKYSSEMQDCNELNNSQPKVASEHGKNQNLSQNTTIQNTLQNIETNQTVKQSSSMQGKQKQNIFWNQDTIDEMNKRQSVWNPELNIDLNRSTKQNIFETDKSVCNSICNTKSLKSSEITKQKTISDGKECTSSALYPQSAVEIFEKQPIHSGSASASKNTEIQKQTKLQNNYIWNPESTVPHNHNKKEVDPTPNSNTLWNPDSSITNVAKHQNLIQNYKKDDVNSWNVHLQNSAVVQNVSDANHNAKQDIYLWDTKPLLPKTNVPNYVGYKSENLSWNPIPGSESQKLDKIHGNNFWNLETAEMGVESQKNVSNTKEKPSKTNKTHITAHSNSSQNTISWKPEMGTYKSQEKKEDTLINQANASNSNQVLQHTQKESHTTWNIESLASFEQSKNQSEHPCMVWNSQTETSKNNHNNHSTKKQDNLLWNPQSGISVSEKKHETQIDKKQGSHLWNPESVVAIDVYKNETTIPAVHPDKQCNNFWYPPPSIAPDVYKTQNIHTCSRYSSQPSTQSMIQSISNIQYPNGHCSKHKEPSTSSNLVFQNFSNNNPNMWSAPYYVNSNKSDMYNVIYANSRIHNHDLGLNYQIPDKKGEQLANLNKDKQIPTVWGTEATKQDTGQRKTNESTNELHISSNTKQITNQNLNYSTQGYSTNMTSIGNSLQNPGLWPINNFEGQTILGSEQYTKSKENIKNAMNNVGNQNDFYNYISNNSYNFQDSDKKQNIWNIHQPQDIANPFDYCTQEGKGPKKENNNGENNKKQNVQQNSINSTKYDIQSYSQSNIQNQNVWGVSEVPKETQPANPNSLCTKQEKNTNTKEKPQTKMEKPVEKQEVNYTLCKVKNTHQQSEGKNYFEEQKSQNGNKNDFSAKTQENVFQNKENLAKTPMEFVKSSNDNNFPMYVESSNKNQKNLQCSSNYNIFADKPKDSTPISNKTVPTSMSNINQNKTFNVRKESDQKGNYYLPTIYPTLPNNNINFQNINIQKSYPSNTYINFNKTCPNPLYTNSATCNYNSTDIPFNDTYCKKIENKTTHTVNYNNVHDSSGSTLKYYNTGNNCSRKGSNKDKIPPQTKPVNWMTTPENKMPTIDYFLPAPSSQSYSLNSCTVTSTEANTISQTDPKKQTEEEKQICWSPSKYANFVDPINHFVTPFLPTLVGDLALGNSSFGETKPPKDSKKKANTSENQASFLSVSQLVNQNKTENTSAKVVARRNSGGRSKTGTSAKNKRNVKREEKAIQNKTNPNNNQCYEMMNPNPNEQFHGKSRNPSKNMSSNYSAEALIGNQISSDDSKKFPETSGKEQGSNFLTENMITYFPTVDDNFILSNQNFPSTTFSHATFQNTSYNTNNFIYTASTIASTYLPNTFEPTLPDFPTDNLGMVPHVSKDKIPPNKTSKNPPKEDKVNGTKKNKKKQSCEGGSAGLEYPFLPVPGSTNSPTLPEDFHMHSNILSSTASYPCKNTIYQKVSGDFNPNPLLPLPSLPRNTIQQPEISPINSASTFTNFNLSSIFPEINKAATNNIFQ